MSDFSIMERGSVALVRLRIISSTDFGHDAIFLNITSCFNGTTSNVSTPSTARPCALAWSCFRNPVVKWLHTITFNTRRSQMHVAISIPLRFLWWLWWSRFFLWNEKKRGRLSSSDIWSDSFRWPICSASCLFGIFINSVSVFGFWAAAEAGAAAQVDPRWPKYVVAPSKSEQSYPSHWRVVLPNAIYSHSF